MDRQPDNKKTSDHLMMAVYKVLRDRKIHLAAAQSSKNIEKYLEKKGESMPYTIYLL